MVIIVRGDGSMAVGLVTSIWKGARKKKLSVMPCVPENCFGFRVIELTPTEALICLGRYAANMFYHVLSSLVHFVYIFFYDFSILFSFLCLLFCWCQIGVMLNQFDTPGRLVRGKLKNFIAMPAAVAASIRSMPC